VRAVIPLVQHYTKTVKSAGGEQQNVTVSLPADLLREVRHMAVDRGVSLSRLIAMLLEEEVEQRQRYRFARDRQLSLLGKGLPLGTHGAIGWNRAELHER
jgi:hypothetical protein